jgi:hypothetical protein
MSWFRPRTREGALGVTLRQGAAAFVVCVAAFASAQAMPNIRPSRNLEPLFVRPRDVAVLRRPSQPASSLTPLSGVSAPPQAAAAGYTTLTFGTMSNFTRSTVDMAMTGAPGYQWYFSSSSGASTLNADGSITIGSFTSSFGNLSSITRSGLSWHGTAIGGGAYLEATLAFDPTTINTATGWPSWWTYSLEHDEVIFGDGAAYDQWAGQGNGFEHFIEPDIMEKMNASSSDYYGFVHDHYGYYEVPFVGCALAGGYCDYQTPFNVADRRVPAGTNFNQYHRYGLLWIPATATRQGSLTYYFDGVQVGPSVTWTQYVGQAPPPGASSPWTFGVIDQQHLILIFGTSATTPMRIKQIVVWQASTANDLRQ